MSESMSPSPKPKVAVGGCGHGMLHSIYASVEQSCRIRGWDGVDLVIIGGDFQAVRNKRDLNITAMPAKYRRFGDFHEYYSGARKAPYLTIFVGGNHEASGHLFELYYGGWVAPNIYYLGAANIVQLGPLRIAGLSGIWKGYDYRKPHFERLPYNNSETTSIFHVRELDVRKMLSVRTQVDVGLSHDWPQGVEWGGDHRWLFRKKDGFEADAKVGRLGSVAAKQCLDRLRPSYWFSAHLHIRYAAMVKHEAHKPKETSREGQVQPEKPLSKPVSPLINPHRHEAPTDPPHKSTTLWSQSHDQLGTSSERPKSSGKDAAAEGSSQVADATHEPQGDDQNLEKAQVSAWRNFHGDKSEEEAREIERQLKAQRDRTAEAERTGVRPIQYAFDETWKQVQVNGSDGRVIASMSRSTRAPGEETEMSNTDGCNEPKSKRPRSKTPDESNMDAQALPPLKLRNKMPGQLDGAIFSLAGSGERAVKDEDEIEIDLSDSAPEDAGEATETSPLRSNKMVTGDIGTDGIPQAALDDSDRRGKSERVMSDDSEEGGVKLDPLSSAVASEINTASRVSPGEDPKKAHEEPLPGTKEAQQEGVSDLMRARLMELSSSFAPVVAQSTVPTSLPFPEEIQNTTTQFLALDKCGSSRHFLQLLELEPISRQEPGQDLRPFTLKYDPEWLAILRVFANELEVGGDPSAKIPSHRADTHYRERILEEEEWIDEHIVRPGRLAVPADFAITAPVYDPDEEVSASDQPFEYSSPQTRAFCALIGIQNSFDSSQEEREMRMARGPRPAEEWFQHRGDRGGWRGSSSRGSRGRGDNRGSSRWAGRGRGRGGPGRGRGRW